MLLRLMQMEDVKTLGKMKEKFVDGFKEWVSVMTLSIIALLIMNVLLFFVSEPIGIINFIVALGAVTVVFVLVKLLIPFVYHITGGNLK